MTDPVPTSPPETNYSVGCRRVSLCGVTVILPLSPLHLGCWCIGRTRPGLADLVPIKVFKFLKFLEEVSCIPDVGAAGLDDR